MEEKSRFVRKISRTFCPILARFLLLASLTFRLTSSQSIGYHPQFNFGFNPYFSPIFGYGLGLPFGAYRLSPAKNPLLLGSFSTSAPLSDKYGLMGKVHAKAFLKKLATNELINLSAYPLGGGDLKDKLNTLKHPQFALTPYGSAYGYGKHYGSAVLPNNPYKSVFADYYDNNNLLHKSKVSLPIKAEKLNLLDNYHQTTGNEYSQIVQPSFLRTYAHYARPVLKTGAFLTSLALLGKKLLETPVRLNPAGMILNDALP